MFFDSILNICAVITPELSLNNFYCDVLFLQIVVLYTLFLLFSATTIYYSLVYLFLLILYLGLITAMLQLELFTGFLWVTELTVLFILLLLCFYLNSTGGLISTNRVYFLVVVVVIVFANTAYSVTEQRELAVFNYIDMWDDFYESHDNLLMTDFYGLFVSYYVFNSPLTCFVFILLFLCSVVCVNLNKVTKLLKKENIGSYLSIFNFFRTFSNSIFYRRQNLVKQNMRQASTKIFKKK